MAHSIPSIPAFLPMLRRLSRVGPLALVLGASTGASAADHGDAPILFGGEPLENPQEARSVVVTQTLRDFAVAEIEIFGGGKRAASPPGEIGESLEIRVGHGKEAAVLFHGEIVAIEPAFGRGTAAARVRGYDLSHRLTRARRTRTWPRTSDAELAVAIAEFHGLSADAVDPGFRSAYVLQRNETDLGFLRQRAARIGYGLSAEGGILHFGPLPEEPVAALDFGAGLRSFVARPNTAAQVEKVEVRGWDPEKKEAIVGTAGSARARAESTLLFDRADPLSEAPSLAEGQLFSPEEATLVARAELSAAAPGGTAAAAGDPRIRAGRVVLLTGLGERFSGRYLVTKATHTIAPSGYTTLFEVRRTDR